MAWDRLDLDRLEQAEPSAELPLNSPTNAGRGDKPNAAEARLLGNSHEFQDLAVRHGLVSPQLHFRVGFGSGNALQGCGQGFFADGFVVQKQFIGLIQAEVDRFWRFASLRTLSLRQVHSNGAGEEWRSQNKNDQQHQHDIDQGRDIDVAKRFGLRAARKTTECHALEV